MVEDGNKIFGLLGFKSDEETDVQEEEITLQEEAEKLGITKKELITWWNTTQGKLPLGEWMDHCARKERNALGQVILEELKKSEDNGENIQSQKN